MIEKFKTNAEVIENGDKYLYGNHVRMPLSIERGEGAYVFDKDGNKYLDFIGGIAVNGLGHCHPAIVKCLEERAHTILHCSNYFYNEPAVQTAKLIVENSCFDKVLFANSGAEANEGQIKLARKYAKDHGHPERFVVITMKNSFHGRTLATCTATGQYAVHRYFEPLPSGFRYAEFNNLQSVKDIMDEYVCAILTEPVQGEGGIIVPPAGYLRDVKEICEKKGALLIADEVQTGIGRTGEWFGVNHDGVTPDLMACAKALGGGVMPIGAIIGTPRAWAGLIEAPFLHTSTFGGNQLACAAGVAAIKAIKEEDMLRRGREAGAYLKAGLEAIAAEYPSVIKEVRGRGMMIGIELTKEGAGGMLMSLMINQHIIVAYTLNNPKVIRMEPPLIMPKEVIDHVLEAFRGAVKETADVIEDL